MLTNNTIGVIIKTLPNLMFKVKLDSNIEVVAGMLARLRLNKVRLLVGDRVLVQCHGNIGKIILRYKI
ncbi:Translation initiation factor IF-1 [Candidatus Hodgkinia cicadicola]|uniref:Translation initiation factor IF-1 n=1 Tax=Candidatus Hodgkinia cicadicola TaxID=573658 RepID=A0ABX4MHD1_9HYPH|nr:Translation initiation factor IF-1 [Candidatus Hodgkinia cicadicola]